MPSDINLNSLSADVLVIGCGGAGLRAAIEVKSRGLKVIVLGKRPKTDAHTVLAAGGINAAFGNLDQDDSWEQHFIDTFLEGYGIGDPEQIEIMVKESPLAVKEIDSWGANFAKLDDGRLDQRFFGAHKYRRTCFSGDFTGLSILNTLLKKAEELEIPIFDSQYVTDLLIKDESCFGAFSFDISTSKKNVFLAKAVILCTGGHTRLWKKSSSRINENTGDGLHLALKAGCKLVDMEMVQFHPSGMVKPEEVAGTLVTEAVRGEGGILLNNKGERFMKNYDLERMELSTRDKVAMANYTEILEGRGTENDAVYLDISHKDKDLIIKKIPTIYRQFLELQNLDISQNPMEVAPTAHYSMGGISLNASDHSTNVNGLFAAGEVAAGLHGANRLGGNSLAEILVFGKRVGEASVLYSRKSEFKFDYKNSLEEVNNNIERFLKKGNLKPSFLQEKLRDIMWSYCGVVKNHELLSRGLKKIREIKDQMHDLDVVVEDNNCQDLISAFDLESSLITAEATILSALERKESRGAHQRSDYKKLNNESRFNLIVSKNNEDDSLLVFKNNLKPLKKGLDELIKKSIKVDEQANKLLE